MHISQAFISDPCSSDLLLTFGKVSLTDTTQPYNIVLHAKDMLTNLEAQNRLEESAHAKLDPQAKLLWMGHVFHELNTLSITLSDA
jgi:hypothetical protein